jgi:hypothetical protein
LAVVKIVHHVQGDREALLKDLGKEQAVQERLATELQKYAASDPDALKAKRLIMTAPCAQSLRLTSNSTARCRQPMDGQHFGRQVVVPTEVQHGRGSDGQAVWYPG